MEADDGSELRRQRPGHGPSYDALLEKAHAEAAELSRRLAAAEEDREAASGLARVMQGSERALRTECGGLRARIVELERDAGDAVAYGPPSETLRRLEIHRELAALNGTLSSRAKPLHRSPKGNIAMSGYVKTEFPNIWDAERRGGPPPLPARVPEFGSGSSPGGDALDDGGNFVDI